MSLKSVSLFFHNFVYIYIYKYKLIFMDQNSFVDDLFYSCLKCIMHIEVGIVQSNQIKSKWKKINRFYLFMVLKKN